VVLQALRALVSGMIPKVRSDTDTVSCDGTPIVRGWITILLMPNTHRRRRRDETVELRRVGGVYINLQLAHDDCRRIRRCERIRRP